MVIGADIYCGIYCQYQEEAPGARDLARASHVTPLLLSPEQGRERERERADRGMLGIGGAHNTLTCDIGYKGRGPQASLRSEIRLCNHKHRTSVQLSWILMQLVITGWCNPECFYPPTALLETAEPE